MEDGMLASALNIMIPQYFHNSLTLLSYTLGTYTNCVDGLLISNRYCGG